MRALAAKVLGGEVATWLRTGTGLTGLCSASSSNRPFSLIESWMGSLQYQRQKPGERCFSAEAQKARSSIRDVECVRRDEFLPDTFSIVGKITEPYARPRKEVFAVVEVGSQQFKVTPDDLIYTEKLQDVEVNDVLSLNRVFLLGSAKQTLVGRPVVPEAHVTAAVEERVRDAKVIVFKKKRRKNYRRNRGHRQELLGLRILDISGLDADGGVVPEGSDAEAGSETAPATAAAGMP